MGRRHDRSRGFEKFATITFFASIVSILGGGAGYSLALLSREVDGVAMPEVEGVSQFFLFGGLSVTFILFVIDLWSKMRK
jgi:hypothetical protein